MIRDARLAIFRGYSRVDLTLRIPDIFAYLQGEDANFETAMSQTLQPLRLDYRGNIVRKTRAIIFVTSTLSAPGRPDLPTLQYRNTEDKTEKYKEVLHLLGFEIVEVYHDPTRDQILDKLANISAEAEAFEKDHANQTIYAFAFIWIGYKLSRKYHGQIIYGKIGETMYTHASIAKNFLLTSTGDVLGHIECLEQISRRSGV
jgi:hypothetical protein